MKRQWQKIIAITLVVAFGTISSARAAGYYYEAVTVTQGEKAKQRDEMTVKAWVDGPKARVEFVTGQEGFFATGNYLLTKDAGEIVYLVDTKERTYAEFDLEQMLSIAGQAMNMMNQMGGVMNMEFTDISNEKLLEEPGGSVLGHDTTHHRFKTGYTMKMAVMGFKQQNRVEMLQDVWCTDDYDARGFSVWLRPDRRFRTGHEGLDELMNNEWSKIEGFPLKSVMVSTTTSKKGKSIESTSTTEVTQLREESIESSVFEIPAGYTETQIVPEMPEGMDEQPEGEKERKGLSGLFKKPKDNG